MIKKYFDKVISFSEIKGHFNKNFKVITFDGIFHLKFFKDGTHEIKKWIEGDTIKKWDAFTLKKLRIALLSLSGNAPTMDLFNLEIKDKRYLELVDKYKFSKNIYCHNDINKDNVIINNDKLHLIDFEFARMNHPYWDYANIVVEDKVDFNLILSSIPELKKEILLDWIYINKVYTEAWKNKWKK